MAIVVLCKSEYIERAQRPKGLHIDLQKTFNVGNAKGVKETYKVRKKNCMMMWKEWQIIHIKAK